MNELTTQQQHGGLPDMGAARGMLPSAANAGAVAIEQERAIAEAQGQLVLAKRFPRDLNSAHAELMMACKSNAFAAVAFYNKPQGGSTVSGPSIRMAEEIARVVGNFQYGHRELSRDEKKSEVEVFAWDMEKNNRSIRQITVLHIRDTRDGPKKLRDQTDVDQKIANVASKAVRGLILAQMPKWLVEDAIQECRKTIAGTNDEPLDVRVRKMTQAFGKFGVKAEHLERYLGHKLDVVLLDELVDLTGIYNAIREGTPASEFFGAQEEAEKTSSSVDAIKAQAIKGAAARKEAATPAPAAQQKKPPAPAPTPAPAPAAEQESPPQEAAQDQGVDPGQQADDADIF